MGHKRVHMFVCCSLGIAYGGGHKHITVVSVLCYQAVLAVPVLQGFDCWPKVCIHTIMLQDNIAVAGIKKHGMARRPLLLTT